MDEIKTETFVALKQQIFVVIRHQMIVALIDRIRQMDNDMIRIDAMCRAAMGIKPDTNRIARADGKKDQRKD